MSHDNAHGHEAEASTFKSDAVTMAVLVALAAGAGYWAFLQGHFRIQNYQVGSILAAIPLLPLLGAITNGLFGRRIGNQRAAFIATSAVLGSFGASIIVFLNLLGGQKEFSTTVYTWFSAGNLDVSLGLVADHLSGVFLMVITGIGSIIHWYSSSYMEHDEHEWRFFAYLNLFIAAMLLLVLGDNLVTMFVGWEGVGLCSYLLIGFWFTDEQKAAAGRKAFITNRIGDFGFVLGIFALFAVFGTTNLPRLREEVTAVVERAPNADSLDKPIMSTSAGIFTAATQQKDKQEPFTYHFILGLAMLCFFIGATGKSAQIPLYVWLPDAMAGPTPVSALIHAATMVTAGIYMICRLSFAFAYTPYVLAIIAITGVLTAFFAALMAFAQTDIKKVLAYSTVSQLGFMFIGVGSGAFAAGAFHVFTHAFFKACLFLGAGAVIHGLANEQDVRQMGGLRKYMKHTHATFLIATITIAGVLPLSGFFSKDEILHMAHHSKVLESVGGWIPMFIYVLGCITALCTSFYMFRVYFLTFSGEYRGKVHPHESPADMTIPLWILAIGSIAAAALAFPIGHSAWEHFLAPALAELPKAFVVESEGIPWGAFGIAIAIAWAGWFGAYSMYAKGMPTPDDDPLYARFPAFANASNNKFWVDEIYGVLIIKPAWVIARWLHRTMDAILIDSWLIVGAARGAAFLSRVLSPFQDGNTQRYAAVTAVSVIGLLIWAVS